MDIGRRDTYDLREPERSREHDTSEVVTARLIAALRLRDPGLADHGHRTAEVACAVGAALGCDETALDRLYTASLLHDIGKLGVSEAILWKPAGLTTGEWTVVRTHPEEGHRLVADVVPRDVASAVLYHHERMDGEGYPFGIPAHSLPLVVRIVQVADAFDAMTSDRPYQGPIPITAALEEIARCAGTQFDPDVAAVLPGVFENRTDARIPEELRHASPIPGLDPPGSVPAAAQPSLISLRGRPV